MQQRIRFCKSADGVRLAYATAGKGPPLVKTSNWLSHLEYDWQGSVWRPFLVQLASAARSSGMTSAVEGINLDLIWAVALMGTAVLTATASF
jgi:hypothetical protein